MIGVVVIFLLSGMFMLGLENTKIFSFLMVSGVLALTTVIGVVAGLRGNFELFTSEAMLPKGVVGVGLQSRSINHSVQEKIMSVFGVFLPLRSFFQAHH